MWVVLSIGILLLGANIAGVLVLQGDLTAKSVDSPAVLMIAVAVGIFFVLLLGIVVVTKAKRR